MPSFVLGDEEKIIKSKKPHFMIIAVHLFLTLITFFLWSPILIYKIIELNKTKYILTTKRVIKETGILNLSSKESQLTKIQNVSHFQSFLGRIFNFGDVTLQTASGMGYTALYGISSPTKFKVN